MRALSASRSTVPVALLALVTALLVWFTFLAPSAEAKQVRLDGVRTTLTTDPATTTVLFGAGIIPLPIAPTPVMPTADAAKYSFPVTGGRVDSKTLVGNIRHSGGLLLAKRNPDNSWTALSLAKFTIGIDAEPHLSAVVEGGARAEIAKLDLSGATVQKYRKHGRAFIKISNVGVTLNKTATDAIDATFGTALTDEVPLGSATVLARVAR